MVTMQVSDVLLFVLVIVVFFGGTLPSWKGKSVHKS
jgi:hypothetical protein